MYLDVSYTDDLVIDVLIKNSKKELIGCVCHSTNPVEVFRFIKPYEPKMSELYLRGAYPGHNYILGALEIFLTLNRPQYDGHCKASNGKSIELCYDEEKLGYNDIFTAKMYLMYANSGKSWKGTPINDLPVVYIEEAPDYIKDSLDSMFKLYKSLLK